MATSTHRDSASCSAQRFGLLDVDPMTNPPNRPIPPHTPVRPTWHDEQRMQAEYDSHDNTCGGDCSRCRRIA